MSAHSWRVVCVASLMALAVSAASACSVSVQGVVFGAYDPFSNVPLESAGRIDIECDELVPYAISLSPGSGSVANRTLRAGSDVLRYNLYVDMLRTTIWGDGTGYSAVAAGVAGRASHPIYGRIPARQNVAVGQFADVVIVTVEF
jgi:spore coat protein U-like protein